MLACHALCHYTYVQMNEKKKYDKRMLDRHLVLAVFSCVKS